MNVTPISPVSGEIFMPMRTSLGTVTVRISCDPKGPVNKIITLCRVDGGGVVPIKSVLGRVEVGTTVTLTHDAGSLWRMGVGWRALNGFADPEPEPFRLPGYRVEIDGRTVLYASDAEIWPAPKPIPMGALKSAQNRAQSLWGAIRKQPRAATDRLARRLGYHRESDCTGWDE